MNWIYIMFLFWFKSCLSIFSYNFQDSMFATGAAGNTSPSPFGGMDRVSFGDMPAADDFKVMSPATGSEAPSFDEGEHVYRHTQCILWNLSKPCWLIFLWQLGTNFSEIWMKTEQFHSRKHEYENVIYKVLAILSQPQCFESDLCFSHQRKFT